MQERLRAIGEVFGIEFPVYQVITKCDVIPFFPDFFRQLQESETGQVLGCTFPLHKIDASQTREVFAEAEVKRLTRAFRLLYQSLAERRLKHLAYETSPTRRPAIYEFPRELKRIRASLVQFLTEAFRPDAFLTARCSSRPLGYSSALCSSRRSKPSGASHDCGSRGRRGCRDPDRRGPLGDRL